MKDSLAACLWHSREQAQATYNRRTANERKPPALDLARRKAEEELVTGPMVSHRPDTAAELEIGVGDFVGLMDEGSTLQSSWRDSLIIETAIPARRYTSLSILTEKNVSFWNTIAATKKARLQSKSGWEDGINVYWSEPRIGPRG